MLQDKIRDLEIQISKAQGDKKDLEEALMKLKLQDFEEELREDPQQLLKGWQFDKCCFLATQLVDNSLRLW